MITIDTETHKMSIPKDDSIFGAHGDVKSKYKHFRIPRFDLDGTDLADCEIRVNYVMNKKEYLYIVPEGDITISDDYINFQWLIDGVDPKSENISFCIEFLRFDGEAHIIYAWHSTTESIGTINGLSGTKIKYEDLLKDSVENIRREITNLATDKMDAIGKKGEDTRNSVPDSYTEIANKIEETHRDLDILIENEGSNALRQIKPIYIPKNYRGLSADGTIQDSVYKSNVYCVVPIPPAGLSILNSGKTLPQGVYYQLSHVHKKANGKYEYKSGICQNGNLGIYTQVTGFVPYSGPDEYIIASVVSDRDDGYKVMESYLEFWTGKVAVESNPPALITGGISGGYSDETKRVGYTPMATGTAYQSNFPSSQKGYMFVIPIEDVDKIEVSADYVMVANIISRDEERKISGYDAIYTAMINHSTDPQTFGNNICGVHRICSEDLGIDKGYLVVLVQKHTTFYFDGSYHYGDVSNNGVLASYYEYLDNINVVYKGSSQYNNFSIGSNRIAMNNLRLLVEMQTEIPKSFYYIHDLARRSGVHNIAKYGFRKGKMAGGLYGGDNGRQVGTQFSLRSYLTALKNANSMAYEHNGWYPEIGYQCIGFMDALCGHDRILSFTDLFSRSEEFGIELLPITQGNLDAIRTGDMLIRLPMESVSSADDGHVAMVIGTTYLRGRLYGISTVEATTPITLFNGFLDTTGGIRNFGDTDLDNRFPNIRDIKKNYQFIMRWNDDEHAMDISDKYNLDTTVYDIIPDRGCDSLYTLGMKNYTSWDGDNRTAENAPVLTDRHSYVRLSINPDVDSIDIQLPDGNFLTFPTADMPERNGLKELKLKIGTSIKIPGRYHILPNGDINRSTVFDLAPIDTSIQVNWATGKITFSSIEDVKQIHVVRLDENKRSVFNNYTPTDLEFQVPNWSNVQKVFIFKSYPENENQYYVLLDHTYDSKTGTYSNTINTWC